MVSIPSFEVSAVADGEATDLAVRGPDGSSSEYRIAGGEQPASAAPGKDRSDASKPETDIDIERF